MNDQQQSCFAQLLDVLCPWHIVIDVDGIITRAGPAVLKVNQGRPLQGTRLLDFLDLRRPKAIRSTEGLLALSGRKLHFVTRDAPVTELKGVITPLPDHVVTGVTNGGVLNLSLGISVVDAVRNYSLTGADFAVTDLTVEMLYLVEANSAVMQELKRLNERLQGARAEAEEQALTDTLTGLGNRRAMDHVLAGLLQRTTGFALMHLDLDHFKQVNDTFGHAAGDAVLQNVAERLRQVTRVGDTVIRQGGDEFILVLPDLTEQERLAALAQRLVNEIERPVQFADQQLHVSASIGISLAQGSTPADLDLMMEEADTALYVVKEQGRHGYRIYSPEMGRMDGNETAA